MIQSQSKQPSTHRFSIKGAMLGATALCATACATSYADTSNTVQLTQYASASETQTTSTQTMGLISAQTIMLTSEAPTTPLPVMTAKPVTAPTLYNPALGDNAPNSVSAPATVEALIISPRKSETPKTEMPEAKISEAKTPVTKEASAQTVDPKMTQKKTPDSMKTSDTSETMEKAEMKSDEKMTETTSKAMSPMNTLLSKYVKASDANGVAHFDYTGLKASIADQKILESYIKSLEAKDPNSMSALEATAFWANLYNAVTIKVVIDNYPVKSIKDIRSGAFSAGPWKKKLTTVNGTPMTLDEIEHGTLRKKYPSPLIHYMVNCASIGCPNLHNKLWEASTLEAERKTAAKLFINSPRGATVTSKGLVVSSIYDWFQEDFGDSKDGVLEHLSQYATGDLKAAIDSGTKIKSFDYDWTLNE